jgi:hypothetical protein
VTLDGVKCGRTVWSKAEESMIARGACRRLISTERMSISGASRDSPIARQATQSDLRS